MTKNVGRHYWTFPTSSIRLDRSMCCSIPMTTRMWPLLWRPSELDMTRVDSSTARISGFFTLMKPFNFWMYCHKQSSDRQRNPDFCLYALLTFLIRARRRRNQEPFPRPSVMQKQSAMHSGYFNMNIHYRPLIMSQKGTTRQHPGVPLKSRWNSVSFFYTLAVAMQCCEVLSALCRHWRR